jgi:hypothetical protein
MNQAPDGAKEASAGTSSTPMPTVRIDLADRME